MVTADEIQTIRQTLAYDLEQGLDLLAALKQRLAEAEAEFGRWCDAESQRQAETRRANSTAA